MTTSFSSLNVTAATLEEVDSVTPDTIGAIPDVRDEAPDLSIFTFDRGRRTGDFFHDVLEQMDFQNPEGIAEAVESKLAVHGFARTLHRPVIIRVLRHLIEVELEPGMSLRQIPMRERLSELEFVHPLASLTPTILAKALKQCGTLEGDIRERMGNLTFDPVKGFMRGFIDLLYRFKGCYYLVDWKSNWLGNRPADYGNDGMRHAMLKHNYFLQYHLYTLAADLFLGKRVPGYSYESHFGGVIYIFLRGVDPANPALGIFRDRPAMKTVSTLRRLIA
jgi:exodeoxyribonuclease V beta subunit